MVCFALKVELALLFLCFIYLQVLVIISILGYISFFDYHVSGRRSLIHSTPAKAEMAAVTRLSLSPVVASNVPNERYPFPYSQQYISTLKWSSLEKRLLQMFLLVAAKFPPTLFLQTSLYKLYRHVRHPRFWFLRHRGLK